MAFVGSSLIERGAIFVATMLLAFGILGLVFGRHVVGDKADNDEHGGHAKRYGDEERSHIREQFDMSHWGSFM